MNGNSKTILIVDDDHAMCYLGFKLVRELGHETVTASTIDGAKTVLETQHVDLVLSDWFFAGKPDGIELHGWMVENSLTADFYIMTAMPDLHPHYQKEFIQKPITTDVIAKVLSGDLSPLPKTMSSEASG